MNLAPFSKVAVTLALTISTLAVTPAVSANAGPLPGTNQSVTTNYYSDATRTVLVGQVSGGSCGENYSWGVRSSYFNYTVITCG